ncbi:hypothetical protein BU54_26275 [Escherichia coli O45:H2 str. 2010C-4211]|nr:hypothetical protein BU54_26275 [Escherichia coli O45:H2 str. 2010C-4211]
MTTKNWKLTIVFEYLATHSSFQHPVRRTFTNYKSGITGPRNLEILTYQHGSVTPDTSSRLSTTMSLHPLRSAAS